MPLFHLIFFISALLRLSFGSSSWCPQNPQNNRKFQQKTDRFWEFQEQSNTWVEVELPYDLVSCVNDNCTKVGSIHPVTRDAEEQLERQNDVTKKTGSLKRKDGDGGIEENSEIVLPLRKRISLAKMSESSIWVTGESGSIYERFWNGVQWVIAPHDLPILTGHAVCIFFVNQSILALSESGILYQMILSESSQPIWAEFTPTLDESTKKEAGQSSSILIKSGVISHDELKIYFCTKNGSLVELGETESPRWKYHGRPPSNTLKFFTLNSSIRPEVVYTISSTGDLYEYDRRSKPSWKKHIWTGVKVEDASLMPSMGCTLYGLSGDYFISLFLLTKGGKLIERRLNQRKWKWVVHGSPKDHQLTSITPGVQDETVEKFLSLFFTTSSGSVFEYRISKQSGTDQGNQDPEAWSSHTHPLQAKVASGISGLQVQVGRIVFALHDGRLAELHLPGLGGENTGPNHQVNLQKKISVKYVWSILDAPETEGWNAEYCREERGPMNCLEGVKDETNDKGITRSIARRRKGSQEQQDYLLPCANGSKKALEEYRFPDNWINSNFRLRMVHGGKSFFLITDGGLTFEYLYAENLWLWLRHDHPTPMKGALGNYNGSLFLVDIYGSLLIRERSGEGLAWVNCTAMRNLGHVVGGPPWDGIPGKALKVTAEDAIFVVSKNGRLLQFTVALRKFEWKDCQNPPNTKVATIVDQELFRDNIVFVIGRNGKLYQYNKVTGLWHEHYQSQHLILSRLPGTAMRASSVSLTGSLFMLSEDGGLVEYHWNTCNGWNWVEHGTPNKGVSLITSPSPCFEGNQLLLVGSDGKVYVRYMDKMTWRWKNCGFPYVGKLMNEDQTREVGNDDNEEVCMDEDFAASLESFAEKYSDFNRNCDPKVAPTRPIPFSDDSVIFELKDGRLAEMRRVEGTHWVWSRTISTPATLCVANYWTAVASGGKHTKEHVRNIQL
ncbi:Magnesium-chelatase [Salix suchowensis]|nr:Magnesium-chelatase [Salix suchowensis]